MLAKRLTYRLLLIALPALFAGPALACPFCYTDGPQVPVQLPVHRELSGIANAALVTPAEEVPSFSVLMMLRKLGARDMQFKVTQVLRGYDDLPAENFISVKALGMFQEGKTYLMRSRSDDYRRASFRELSDPAANFLTEYAVMFNPTDLGPGENIELLRFFLPYLDSPDDTVARAALFEFAEASFDTVSQLHDRIRLPVVQQWIDNPRASKPPYGLYFLLLGVSGDPKALPLLKHWMSSPRGDVDEDLAAMLAAYLLIAGGNGAPDLVAFVSKADAARRKSAGYALMNALRFHHQYADRLKAADYTSIYRQLTRERHIAYRAIWELKQLSDWDALSLVWSAYQDHLAGETDRQTGSLLLYSVRIYLQSCPGAAAKEHLASLPKRWNPESS